MGRLSGGSRREAVSSFDAMWADARPIGRDARTGGYRAVRLDARGRRPARVVRRRGRSAARAGRRHRPRRQPVGLVGRPRPRRARGSSLGSHLDSVPDGGAFDGPLGVVSAFAALDALRARGFTPDRPLGVACFADEEGARFGVACAGSRLLTGALDADRARGADRRATARRWPRRWRAAGRDPARSAATTEALRADRHVRRAARRAGPRARRHRRRRSASAARSGRTAAGGFDLRGRANHAGTTRLADRDDPMLALAALILAARAAAERHGALATVGKVQRRSPTASTRSPRRSPAWLDARGAGRGGRPRGRRRASPRRPASPPVEESWTPRTPLRRALARPARRALARRRPGARTGAGHDAGILAAAGVPTAMLFVRNPTGVSHSPAEFAEPRRLPRRGRAPSPGVRRGARAA